MRPQKSQIPDRIKFGVTPGTLWDRSLAMHAGYTNFTVAVVGAAGGRGGNSTKNADNTIWGAGGGGGGSFMLNGKLKDLSGPNTLVIVGAAGAHGADKPVGTKGASGLAGGLSSFYEWTAFGGQGGTGGDLDYSSQLGGSGFVSDGGDGGDNSLGLGNVGQGAIGNNVSNSPAVVSATGGTSEVQVQIGGGGGGGGAGRAVTNGQTNAGATKGAAGNQGFTLDHAGGASVGSKGGDGGGANVTLATGTAEYYGSYAAGATPDGVVAILLS